VKQAKCGNNEELTVVVVVVVVVVWMNISMLDNTIFEASCCLTIVVGEVVVVSASFSIGITNNKEFKTHSSGGGGCGGLDRGDSLKSSSGLVKGYSPGASLSMYNSQEST
jgi:hypothetical protein